MNLAFQRACKSTSQIRGVTILCTQCTTATDTTTSRLQLKVHSGSEYLQEKKSSALRSCCPCNCIQIMCSSTMRGPRSIASIVLTPRMAPCIVIFACHWPPDREGYYELII